MANSKQKQQKKKERERRVRKKILALREYKRRINKAEEEKELSLLAEYEGPRKIMPIMAPEKKEAMIKSKLQRNIEVLKALEEQYLAENSARRQVNEQLEADGHSTLKEKLDALNAKAQAALASADEKKDKKRMFEKAIRKLQTVASSDTMSDIAVASLQSVDSDQACTDADPTKCTGDVYKDIDAEVLATLRTDLEYQGYEVKF